MEYFDNPSTTEFECMHECDTKNEHNFPFWMHKLPSGLRKTLLSYSLSALPQASHVNKTRAIRSLSPAIIPGMIARLLDQIRSSENSVTSRRDALLSLKIISDIHLEVILANRLLSQIFQGALETQDDDIPSEDSGSLAILDICIRCPVIGALEFIHHISRTFPTSLILQELYKVLAHVKSSQPLRRFYGLMVFVISTGPCADNLLPLSINVVDEIAHYAHQHPPLVDFALSMLISSWGCRRRLFRRCIELNSLFIPMFVASIERRSSTTCGSDLTCAAISCWGLQALLEKSHYPISYIPDCVRCFIGLTNKLLQDDHGQPLQVAELPLEALGYAAMSVGSEFFPYLESVINTLKHVTMRVPLSSCEPIHWTAGGVIGDCVKAVGGKAVVPHLFFFVQNVLNLGTSIYPRLRLMAYRVLAVLTAECPGTMSPYMGQLVSMLLKSIWGMEPNVQSYGEYCLSISEKSNAISAINCLATSGSILFKFVGAACRINMTLLAHQDQTIRTQACDCLLDQILRNNARSHLHGELLRYVAFYVRRLDKGIYLSSEDRLEHSRSTKIKAALALVQDSLQPLPKILPTSHAPLGLYLKKD